MTDAQNSADAREKAIREWEQQTDGAGRGERQFSGERVKRMVEGEWLGKIAFVAGTAAVLFFILTHDSKQERARRSEARAAMQVDEPSVRDFRPPVMPARPTPPAKVEAGLPQPTQTPPAKSAEDAAAAARRQKAEQLDAARTKSDIIVRAASASSSGAVATSTAPPSTNFPGSGFAAGAGNRAGPASEEPADPNRAFARQASGRTVPRAVPGKLGNLDCLALQGKVIDAELETAIDSDLPGQIRAIVAHPLYAEQGKEILLTPGSRLVGVYNTAVRKGQVRIFAIWNRVIRPDGVEIAIDSVGTDALGRSGLVGETDNHFGQIFGMSALLSIIGAGAGTAGVGSDARYNSADDYRREVQQSFARTSDRLLGPYAAIPPTISVRQGERIKVLLNRDLDFCPLRARVRNQAELVLP